MNHKHFTGTIFSVFALLFCALFIFPLGNSSQLEAEESTSQGSGINVRASVGEFLVTLSGIIAHSASVSLKTTDGIFLTAVSADPAGVFTFSNVLVSRGFDGFCINAKDFRNLGESDACISIPPVTANTSIGDIFLPPTLGIEKTEVESSAPVRVFGYSMPGAIVVLHVGTLQALSTTADEAGYYTFDVVNLPSGTYRLYTVATYEGKESIKPTSYKDVKVLGFSGSIVSKKTNWFLIVFVLFWILLLLILYLFRKQLKKLLKRDKR